jgi:hypothetical protein
MAKQFKPFGMPDTPFDPMTGKYLGLGDLLNTDPGQSGDPNRRHTTEFIDGTKRPPEERIDLDTHDLEHADQEDVGTHDIKFRELLVPRVQGGGVTEAVLVYNRRQVLASEPYHTDIPVGSLIRLRELLDVEINVPALVEGSVLRWNYAQGRWEGGDAAVSAATDPGAAVVTIGANAEGDEDELTDTWTAGTTNGLKEWYVARIVYKHTGDKKLYAFLRYRIFDRNGMLYYVSAETRVEVDAAEAES